jgi:type 1 fimbria pilin
MHTIQKIIITFSFLMIGSANAFTDDSEAYSATVSAEIEANPCVVMMPDTITFDAINVSDIPSFGANQDVPVAGNDPQHIDIRVSNCPSGQHAFIAVSGTLDSNNTHLLANTATENAATNVGVGFWDESTGTTKPLQPIYGTSPSVNVAYEGHFYLVAGLQRVRDEAVTPGEVSTAAQVIVTYL